MLALNRKILLLIVCSVMFVFISCATSNVKDVKKDKNAPDWISGEDSRFPESEYVIGVGYGDSREKAENEAISALVKVIRQDIKTQTTASQFFSENSSGTDSNRAVVDTVVTNSEISSIPGVSIKETWTDKNGTVYVLSILQRSQAGNYFSQKATEIEKSINDLILYANSNNDSFEGYAALLRAVSLANQNQENLDILAGIHPMMRSTQSVAYGSPSDINNLASIMLERIVIGVYTDGDTDSRISSTLRETVSQRGFRTGLVEVSDKVVPYILISSFELQDVEMDSIDKFYVRYIVNVALTDTRTGKILLPFTINGREAQLSKSEADQRAVRTAEKNIRQKFGDAFDNFLVSLGDSKN